MNSNREALTRLKPSAVKSLDVTSGISLESTPLLDKKTRPLGAFSNFIVDKLGDQNKLVREGQLTPNQLFDQAEALVGQIPETTFQELLQDDNVAGRRGAILDLVWMVRSLDIAHDSAFNTDPDYIARRDASLLFQRTKLLTDREGRHPNLSWSDISLYHPVDDPRTFLEPGAARDQEILLYRTQAGIDKTFKALVEGDYSSLSHTSLEEMSQDMDAVVDAVVYLNRVRNPGQFYQLDPYLGGNGQYIGHGTGAFSAWSYLAGYFLGENEAYKDRLLRPDNQRAFDRDADPLIEQVRTGKFKTLSQLIAESPMDRHQRELAQELQQDIAKKFSLFLRAHRGAIRKHAPGSLAFEAPAALDITNTQSIDGAIADMHDGKPV